MISSQPPKKPEWRTTLTALTFLLAWIFFWYWETITAMSAIWARSDTYAHGFIVPPIALWLIWRERSQLQQYQPNATAWLTLPLLATIFIWLLGELTAVNALTQFSVITIIVLNIMSLIGLRLSARLAFPLVFLFFAAPIGDFMLPKLMEWTAGFTILALRASGIPVYREGLQFVIPSGNWSVIEACSGIRYIIASVTVGTLFAYLNYTSLKRRLIFIAVSMLVPVLANWFRAYLIVLLGHLSNNKLAVGVDHLVYGWVFFGIVIVIMFMIGMRWSEPPEDVIPTPEQFRADISRHRTPWVVTLVLALIAAIAPLAVIAISKTETSKVPTLSVPLASNGWQPSVPVTSWKPTFLNPSAELQAAYLQDGNTVGLYIAYYRNQDYERKLITSTNVLANSFDKDWATSAQGKNEIVFNGSNQTIRTAELIQKNTGLDTRLTVWQVYWINGHLTTSDFEAKLYAALSRLTGQGDDSAVIVIFAPTESAAIALPAFVSAQGTGILQTLANAKQQ